MCDINKIIVLNSFKKVIIFCKFDKLINNYFCYCTNQKTKFYKKKKYKYDNINNF